MLPKEYDIDGKVILITGAGRGIGRGIAEVLAEAGAQIALNALTNQFVEKAAKDISVASGRRVMPLLADVTNPGAVQQMVETVLKEFGRLDVLINGLGDAIRAPLVKMPDKDGTSISDQELKRIIDINLTATILCTRAVGLHFLSRRSGKIVNISSTMAVSGGGDTVIYSLAKSAVIGFTRAQAIEWAPYNIQINSIAPGSSPRASQTSGEGTRKVAATGTGLPSERYGRPRAAGLLALYLVSSASDYMTGQTLFLDGGLIS